MIYDNASYNLVGSKGQDLARLVGHALNRGNVLVRSVDGSDSGRWKPRVPRAGSHPPQTLGLVLGKVVFRAWAGIAIGGSERPLWVRQAPWETGIKCQIFATSPLSPVR